MKRTKLKQTSKTWKQNKKANELLQRLLISYCIDIFKCFLFVAFILSLIHKELAPFLFKLCIVGCIAISATFLAMIIELAKFKSGVVILIRLLKKINDLIKPLKLKPKILLHGTLATYLITIAQKIYRFLRI